MKMTILAALAVMSLGLAPAMAAEGNGDPFPNTASAAVGHTVLAAPLVADTGSAAYPNFAGYPGSNLPALAGDVLPSNGSEGAVQTANSLPAHFEEGTVAYAQANRVHNWMVAHARRSTPAYAAASPVHAPGG